MERKVPSIAILTSGGDSQGIYSALRKAGAPPLLIIP